jgi:general stress protein YciG
MSAMDHDHDQKPGRAERSRLARPPKGERTAAGGSRAHSTSPSHEERPSMPTVDTGKPRARRGFAAMNPERRREIARKGGASVPGEKRSFAKDRDLAASAGRKGGEASRGGGRTRGRES